MIQYYIQNLLINLNVVNLFIYINNSKPNNGCKKIVNINKINKGNY